MFGHFFNRARSVFILRTERQSVGPSSTPISSQSEQEIIPEMVTTRSYSRGSPQVDGPANLGRKRKIRHEDVQRPPVGSSKRNRGNLEISPSQSTERSEEETTEVEKSSGLPLRPYKSPVTALPTSDEFPIPSNLTSGPRSATAPGSQVDARYSGDGKIEKRTSTRKSRSEEEAVDLDEDAKIWDDSTKDSDADEAPETVSVAKSQMEARASLADATKAIQNQKKVEKDQRRKRDSRFKTQAQSASSRPNPMPADRVNSKDTPGITAYNIPATERLPEFLPAEVLNAAPSKHASKPSTLHRKPLADHLTPQRGKEDQTKDISREGRLVRVLGKSPSSQKLSKHASSKHMREDLLLGRRRGVDNVLSKRKPIRKRFLT